MAVAAGDDVESQKGHDSISLKQELEKEIKLLTDRLAQLERHVRPPNSSEPLVNNTHAERLDALEGRTRDDSEKDSLPEDTFTLMMLSKIPSQAWLLGLLTFAFQVVLSVMIAENQLRESIDSSEFNAPFKVDPVVRAGQFFTIVYFIASEDDITSSIRFLVMFWNVSDWERKFREHNLSWYQNFLVPNGLRFIQGIIVLFISFVIIVQSDDIIILLKDFTALMILSDTDNIFFGLAVSGYFGPELQQRCIDVKKIKIEFEVISSEETSVSDHTSSCTNMRNRGFVIRPFILIGIAFAMVGGWLNIVINQITGVYFEQRYPECNRTVPNAFELAAKYFGDDICYGGPLNTLECEFEGGDCINFNLAFPLCKGNNLTDVEGKVGNGICDTDFNKPECNFDGSDCGFKTRYPNCPYLDLAEKHFGDGICYGGPLNTLECQFEGGDCINFNLAFPLCRGDNRTDVQDRVGDGTCDRVFMDADCDYDGGDCCPYDIINSPSFGDSQCNGGIPSTEVCGYDNGDCKPFRLSYPKCPFDQLATLDGADDVILGDGVCDSSIYNTEDCGYENGDCTRGQVGQSIIVADDIRHPSFGRIYFSKAISLDGSTVALGFYRTDKDGIYSGWDAPGLVRVWRYNKRRKVWLQLGMGIFGPEDGDNVGYGLLSFSINGDHIAISSRTGLKIWDYNSAPKNRWSQVGQTLTSTLGSSIGIVSADGLRVALIYNTTDIRVYNLQVSSGASGQQEWVHREGLVDTIKYNGVDLSSDWTVQDITYLRFWSNDGSRMLVHVTGDVQNIQMIQIDLTTESWIQMGDEAMKSPESFTPPAISAADVNRIAVVSNSASSVVPGQVDIYNYDASENTWVPMGDPIKSSSSKDGDGFGNSVSMSSDGNFLVVATNNPDCRDELIPFHFNKCITASIELYNYNRDSTQFQSVPPNPSFHDADSNTLNLVSNLLTDSNRIFGLHFSLSGDGRMLSISGYNFDDNHAFVRMYDLDELFYTKCVVDEPERIGDGVCHDMKPTYNSKECGFDGGDCVPKPVKDYPNCTVHYTSKIGNGYCNDFPPYNTTECGFDGGDCVPKPVKNYTKCLLPSSFHHRIGNGLCNTNPPYNTSDCGYDGGDCIPKAVDGYPDCFVLKPSRIGDGHCNDFPPYNTEKCGHDGGDCQ